MICTRSSSTGPIPRLWSAAHGVGPSSGRRSRCTRGTAVAGSIRSPSWNSRTTLRRRSRRRLLSSLTELASSTMGAVTGSRRRGTGISRSTRASSGVMVTLPSVDTSRTSASSTSASSGSSASSGIRMVQCRPWPRVARPMPSRCTCPAPGPEEIRTSTRPWGSGPRCEEGHPRPRKTPWRIGLSSMVARGSSTSSPR